MMSSVEYREVTVYSTVDYLTFVCLACHTMTGSKDSHTKWHEEHDGEFTAHWENGFIVNDRPIPEKERIVVTCTTCDVKVWDASKHLKHYGHEVTTA